MRLAHSRSIIIFVLLFLFLVACTGSDELAINCNVFEDNFDQVAETAVAVGDEFTVTLCALRNHGYRWSEEVVIDHPQVIQLLTHDYEPGRSPMGGIPGKEMWTFRALEPGTATINLEHTQPSGRNAAGIWTYQLKVTVEPTPE